jgi:putative endonuclease
MTRSSAAFGGAAASVDDHKQRRTIRAAHPLLQQRRDCAALPVRFGLLIVPDPLRRAPQVYWLRRTFAA